MHSARFRHKQGWPVFDHICFWRRRRFWFWGDRAQLLRARSSSPLHKVANQMTARFISPASAR